MTVWAVLVAAGSGSRFGGPKHTADLLGRPVWQWSRDALLAGGASGMVVVGDVPGGIPGGSRRRDSVAAGLDAVPADVAHVLVHDAARPLLSEALVRRVVAALEGGAVAVVPALPVADTLKEVDGSTVLATVDRSRLVAVQTPQGFRTTVLREAHGASDADATDDAALVESLGVPVTTVEGDPANVKVTYPGDLDIARCLLGGRG